jgi:hypothetical protein
LKPPGSKIKNHRQKKKNYKKKNDGKKKKIKKFLAFWGVGVFVNQAAGVALGKTTVVDHGRASVRIDAEAHHHVIKHQSGRTMRITVGHTGMGCV